jgi:predicted AAA+ superfamily ATPase
MITRSLSAVVAQVAKGYPVLVITGPRQAGKTTLAQACFPHLPYVSLEDPLERSAFLADPRAWLARYGDGAVLDEIQRIPDLPSYLQGLVDRDRRMGRWVVTGSQQYQVRDRVPQSLAGRAALLELMPFSHAELAAAGLAAEDPAAAIWKGGYPPLYDRPVDPGRWLGDYIATYLERDVRSIAAVRDLTRFASFLRLCAVRTGQIVNLATMASDLGIDAKTVRGWMSVLVTGYIVHLLPPHHANLGKRISRHPKMYLLDTGLACRLMSISDPDALRAHPAWGALVETWIVSECIKARRARGLPADVLYYWRSHDGREVDLVMEEGRHWTACEIKATTSPGQADLEGLLEFGQLAGKRVVRGVLFHLGRVDGTLRGNALTPWNAVDALVGESAGRH